jgi:hypothetical protein
MRPERSSPRPPPLSLCAPAPQSFGVVGGTGEAPSDVEGVAGLSITLASLPGVEVSITHTLRSGVPDEGGRAGRGAVLGT